jgi:hypothetical protein
LKVWTNGNAIRKYTGQDKIQLKQGWNKKIAIIMTEEEYEEYLKLKKE